MRGEKPMQVEMPMNYSISRELAKLPSAERKEFVVITEKSSKSAEVILPAGASMKVNNEIPGMNKSRIASALKKEGIDGDNITFYNAGGALGLHQPNGYFEGKDIMVNRLKQYNLIPVTRLNVSSLIAQKAEIEKVNLFADEDNNYAIFIKAKGEQPITMYPAKEDITLFFKSLKEPNGNAVRSDLGQKYYQLSHEHPELKKDLLTIDVGDVDLGRISNVNLFKSDSKAGIFMTATIDGKKQESREIPKQTGTVSGWWKTRICSRPSLPQGFTITYCMRQRSRKPSRRSGRPTGFTADKKPDGGVYIDPRFDESINKDKKDSI